MSEIRPSGSADAWLIIGRDGPATPTHLGEGATRSYAQLIVLGEAHLRLAVREYVAHYKQERPHQGLGGDFVVPPANANHSAPIQTRQRLGGLLRYYHRQAA